MTLPEDMIIYCAYDVVPLLQLYGILQNSIQEDFQTLLHDLTQDILIRPVDEKLVKLRNRTHRKQREKQLFVVMKKSKGEIYEMIQDFDGEKSVMKSDKTAVITLNR